MSSHSVLRGNVALSSVGPMIWALSAVVANAEVDVAKFITVRPGNIAIIISAPHGGDRMIPDIAKREDRGQKFFETVRDQRTAELAELISKNLERLLGGAPFIVIAKFDRRQIDANRAAEDAFTPPGDGGPKLVYEAYHKALADAAAEVTRRWGCGLLLDIHGQARFPDAIVRGTQNGQTVMSLVKRYGEEAVAGPRSFFGALGGKGYSIAPTGEGDDRIERFFQGGHIVDTHGSRNGGAVDAIQVEIGARHRMPERLEATARDLAAAAAVFADAYLPKAKARGR